MVKAPEFRAESDSNTTSWTLERSRPPRFQFQIVRLWACNNREFVLTLGWISRICNDEYGYRTQLNSERCHLDWKCRRNDRFVRKLSLFPNYSIHQSKQPLKPPKLIPFSPCSAHRALHLSTINSKLLIPHYYSSSASFSYYAGCSSGGRQGWSEAQRYPTDFNGVLVGAPANWQTRLPAWDIRVALEQFPNSKESFIPESMWEVIHEAVVGMCDGLDGVVDGLVSDPTR